MGIGDEGGGGGGDEEDLRERKEWEQLEYEAERESERRKVSRRERLVLLAISPSLSLSLRLALARAPRHHRTDVAGAEERPGGGACGGNKISCEMNRFPDFGPAQNRMSISSVEPRKRIPAVP